MGLTADVVVAGAGPAGAALAIRLARAGARVVVLDDRTADPARWPDLPGERLGADAALACEAIGLPLEQCAVPEAAMVRRWAGAGTDATPQPRPGWLVSRRDLDAALLVAARRAGADVRTGEAFAGVSGKPGAWRIDTASVRHRLAAALVVDATGRRGAVARALGQQTPRRTDTMTAILRWATGADSAPAFAIEALGAGWTYGATLPGGRAVAGVVLPRGTWSGRPGPAWDRALAGSALMAPLLRDPTLTWGAPAVLPATPALAPLVLGPGWALVGDAARQADPIAGRGVLHAMEGAARLAGVILSPDGTSAAAAAQAYTSWLRDLHHDHLDRRATLLAPLASPVRAAVPGG